jgi:phage shock protein PspC (stress-responsive transcriptional regulator)
MKKTISINIAGVAFYVEEDSFDKLRHYLTAIQRYFSSYEGADEIVADIEGRIAERFLDKLKKDQKQAITAGDIDELMAAMGTVADFEAIEEAEDLQQGTHKQTGTPPSPGRAPEGQRTFVLDESRKIVAGVCAGLAYYFRIDPVWVRVFFVLLVIGAPFLGSGFSPSPLAFTAILAYVACWAAFPVRTDIQEDNSFKKLFRSTDRKAVGGVAAGLAIYSGLDLGLIRFLFVVSILLGGFGLISYFILWAVTPETRTLTDQMQLKGERITLENIESNIRQSLHSIRTEESPAAKIALAPVRAVGKAFTFVAPALGGIGTILRVFMGLIVTFISLAFCVALIVALVGVLGVTEIANHTYMGGDWPISLIADELSPKMAIFPFLAFMAPSIALGILGVSLMAGRNIFSSGTVQVLSVLFLMGIVSSIVTVVPFARNFKSENQIEKVETYAMPAGTLTLDLKGKYPEFDDLEPSLRLEGQGGTDFQIVRKMSARGKNREAAGQNAQQIVYSIAQTDSLFAFDREFSLAPQAKYRDQGIRVLLKVPYEKVFFMSRRLARRLHRDLDLDAVSWGVGKVSKDSEDLDKAMARFKFTTEGELVCLDEKEGYQPSVSTDGYETDDDFEMIDGDYKKTVEATEFRNINAGGRYYIEIKRGDKYRVELSSEDEESLRSSRVSTSGGTLRLEMKNKIFNFREREPIYVRITMPQLETVDMSGACKAKARGFDQNQDLKIMLSGESTFWGSSMTAQKIDIDLSGASVVHLAGQAKALKIDMSGSSRVYAFDLKAEEANIDSSGDSDAEVSISKDLKISNSGDSDVTYLGNPKISENSSGSSSVRRAQQEENN